jgi:hypothetical protein
MRFRLRTLLLMLAVGPPLLYLAWVYFPFVELGIMVAALEMPLVVAPILCFALWRRGLLNVGRFFVIVAIAATLFMPALMAWGSHKFHRWVETAVMP